VAIDLPGSGEIVEIISSRFGLFAMGVDGEGASLWRSADGVAWDLVDVDEGLFANAEMHAMAETDSGLVAVGARRDPSLALYDDSGNVEESRRPAVWLSPDGATWERLPDEKIGRSIADVAAPGDDRFLGAMSDVVVWEGRLVAVGWGGSNEHHGAAWVADIDGVTWELAGAGLAGIGTAFTEVTSVSVTDRGLVAVGSTMSKPSVWVSEDAMTWSWVEPSTGLGTSLQEWPVQVTSGGVGIVAVGNHGRATTLFSRRWNPYAVTWVSRDGEEWVRLAPEELEGVMFEGVIAADPWLVAAGSGATRFSTRPGVWYSTTGAEWSGVDLAVEGYERGESTVNTIAQGGPGLVAGGTLQGNPELWVWSSDGSVELSATAWARPDPGRWVLRSELGRDFPVWSIGVVPSGYVAVGEDAVWVSPDGAAWEPVPFEETGLAPGRWYSAPVTIDGTVYMVDDSTIWSSPGGRFWTSLGGGFEGHLEGPRAGPSGALVLVEHPDTEDQPTRLWRSSDAVRWTEVPLPAVDWIDDVGFVGSRYFLVGWSQGPHLWVSAEEGSWEAVELDGGLENSRGMVELDGRLLLPVVIDQEYSVTRILSSTDGLNWEPSETEFTGWLDQIVRTGPGVAMLIFQGAPGWGLWDLSIAVWSSQDGVQWTELGPLPADPESWGQLLPGTGAITVIIENAGRASLWEWVPPAG